MAPGGKHGGKCRWGGDMVSDRFSQPEHTQNTLPKEQNWCHQLYNHLQDYDQVQFVIIGPINRGHHIE